MELENRMNYIQMAYLLADALQIYFMFAAQHHCLEASESSKNNVLNDSTCAVLVFSG